MSERQSALQTRARPEHGRLLRYPVSTKIHNRREGDRSEYFAQVLLSGLGLSSPIPRQEDIGVDFLCSLADQRGGVLTFGNPYFVSVKSLSKPDIILEPTDAAIAEDNPRHLLWLFRQELPLFLGVVDKDKFSMRLYSLAPVWFIHYLDRNCGGLVIKPRLDPSDTRDVGRPRDLGEIEGWRGAHRYELDLGHPIAIVDLDALKDTTALEAVRDKIRRASRHARTSETHRQLGIPYFQWLVKTQPDAKSFYPGFMQLPVPPDEETRRRIMMGLAPSLIAFALHYKASGANDELRALSFLFRDIPREFFEQPIREALPELFL